MQHRHQGFGEIVLAVAGGDPHIIGNPAGKGMVRDIEPAVRGLEANRVQQALGQGALDVGRKRPGERHRLRAGGLMGLCPLDEDRQKRLEVAEDGIDLRRAEVGIVTIEQRIVRRAAKHLGTRRGDLSDEAQHLIEQWGDAGEIVGAAGLAPGHLRGRSGARIRRGKIRRERRGAPPRPPHLAEVGGLPRAEIGRLGFVEEPGEGGIGQLLVVDGGQGRQLLGPRLGSARRHHGR